MNDYEISEKIYKDLVGIANDNGGKLPLSQFVKVCLFEFEYSYYRADRIRTGTKGDFYTSSNLKGSIFAKLIYASCKSLIKSMPEKVIEIGAEPNNHLFENAEVLKLGDNLNIDGKNILVFSNELLDSRPFDRFVKKSDSWLKTYLEPKDGKFTEYLLECSAYENEFLNKYFKEAFDGFILDFSFDAIDMFKNICSQNWTGALIFVDYFRTSLELLAFEKGTCRRYKKMQEFLDIYTDIGVSDLTHSPSIEPLKDILEFHNFESVDYATQESFFMHNAQAEICELVANTSPLSPQKGALMELLSPDYFGSVFRCLYAVRKTLK